MERDVGRKYGMIIPRIGGILLFSPEIGMELADFAYNRRVRRGLLPVLGPIIVDLSRRPVESRLALGFSGMLPGDNRGFLCTG